MRILFAASEAYPLIKTGGLADVASGLPAALSAQRTDVRIILPAYPEALDKAQGKGASIALGSPLGLGETSLIPAYMPDSGVPVLLVDCPSLFNQAGGPYVDAKGQAWANNHLRFALLSKAAAMVCKDGADGWRPHVLHANDWHTGLASAYLKNQGIPSVFTIHNIHYQGLFEAKTLQDIGLSNKDFTIDGVEYYGKVSFLKAGLQFSSRITTVSPTYAREIQEPEMGEGLHGLLTAKSGALKGILNGVDYKLWNPDTDAFIAANYSPGRLKGKAECKRALQHRLGLAEDADAPLLGMVSRFTHQKGIDILLNAFNGVLDLGCQVAVLGSGEAKFERALSKLAANLPERIAVNVGYDEELAHGIQAGTDMILVPSRFEPCGLTQLYALKYGTLPVVRRTGGLADSIVDVSEGETATGFVFDAATSKGLLGAIGRSINLYRQPKKWRRVQKNAMKQDFSWRKAAREYISIYKELL